MIRETMSFWHQIIQPMKETFEPSYVIASVHKSMEMCTLGKCLKLSTSGKTWIGRFERSITEDHPDCAKFFKTASYVKHDKTIFIILSLIILKEILPSQSHHIRSLYF